MAEGYECTIPTSTVVEERPADNGTPRPPTSDLAINFLRGLRQHPSWQETEQEGYELFGDFVRYQLQTSGIENHMPTEQLFGRQWSHDSGSSATLRAEAGQGYAEAGQGYAESGQGYAESESFVNSPFLSSGYSNPLWAEAGRNLRDLAQQFAQSPERERIRDMAAQVDISHMSKGMFLAILHELFSDGITRERIVTLFFFCTDLVLRALRTQGINLFHRLVEWSWSFIRERVCTWVQHQGGWGIVLGSYIRKAVLTFCAITVTVGSLVYIKKVWFG